MQKALTEPLSEGFTNSLKYSRVLLLYSKLMDRGSIDKATEAQKFGVSTKSIQRGIDDLRAFLADDTTAEKQEKQLVYNRNTIKYALKYISVSLLTNSETLAVAKFCLKAKPLQKTS